MDASFAPLPGEAASRGQNLKKRRRLNCESKAAAYHIFESIKNLKKAVGYDARPTSTGFKIKDNFYEKTRLDVKYFDITVREETGIP